MALRNKINLRWCGPQLRLLLWVILWILLAYALFVSKVFHNMFGAEEFSSSGMPFCPTSAEIANYTGRLPMNSVSKDIQEAEIQANHSEIQPGGCWKPAECESRTKVAIVIPYRDRQQHLHKLLNHIFPILQTQLLDFRIIVVEQNGTDLFNRGRLLNAGVRLAQELEVDCLILHDVDMLPENDKIPYSCSKNPRHLGAFVNTLNYTALPYDNVGGVLSIQMSDYVKVNGHSNLFWGWGGEDDDLATRLTSQFYVIEQLDPQIDRYTMLSHEQGESTVRSEVLRLLSNSRTRWPTDGLKQKSWEVISVEKLPLYYRLLVDFGKSPEFWHKTKN